MACLITPGKFRGMCLRMAERQCSMGLIEVKFATQDSVLRPHMKPILETLYSNMQAFAKSAAATAVQPATLRLAMHVVNGLLAELRH